MTFDFLPLKFAAVSKPTSIGNHLKWPDLRTQYRDQGRAVVGGVVRWNSGNADGAQQCLIVPVYVTAVLSKYFSGWSKSVWTPLVTAMDLGED